MLKNFNKYAPGYFNVPATQQPTWAMQDHIQQAPIWCSVDLRDGNQSLVVPMNLDQKLEFFSFLVSVGFKEIEVGFPAASETEFELLRALIEQDLVPSDVTLQVLTQCRPHIIEKTFDALDGVQNAIVHFYNSTSQVQREQVFKRSKDEIKVLAVDSAKVIKKLADAHSGNIRFQYSPESFTGTEPDYALEVCNEVLEELQPAADNKVIINLPSTVQLSMPHVYANQIQYMSDRLAYREHVIISTHPHNDRGCAVADAELAQLAGAQRVEGTLFGNGERTGNVDVVTLAMNLFTHGVDPQLNFSDMPAVVAAYEKATGMHVFERQPYAGTLVFAAFSGSHQDAIAKGMRWREEHGLQRWNVPYLPINPADVGREYETDVIRINSQSGKGGIGYLMEQNFGYTMPPKMCEHFGYLVKDVSDKKEKELTTQDVYTVFENSYLDKTKPMHITAVEFAHNGDIQTTITVYQNDERSTASASGNGRLDAVSNALKKATGEDFSVLTYAEHALETGSTSEAVAYVGLAWQDGAVSWGAAHHADILMASIDALVSAYNNHLNNV